jgi:hypothetical protein
VTVVDERPGALGADRHRTGVMRGHRIADRHGRSARQVIHGVTVARGRRQAAFSQATANRAGRARLPPERVPPSSVTVRVRSSPGPNEAVALSGSRERGENVERQERSSCNEKDGRHDAHRSSPRERPRPDRSVPLAAHDSPGRILSGRRSTGRSSLPPFDQATTHALRVVRLSCRMRTETNPRSSRPATAHVTGVRRRPDISRRPEGSTRGAAVRVPAAASRRATPCSGPPAPWSAPPRGPLAEARGVARRCSCP